MDKPPTIVQLVWEHELVLAGTSDDILVTLDSASKEGPSPMQALAFGLAGCMAMDVIHVLRKGRHDLRGLRTDLKGHRAATDPHRFTAIELHFTVTGTLPQDQVQRAIDLSRQKYCSVWHSMRQDIDLQITYDVSQGV